MSPGPSGYFSDGKTAERHAVTVRMTPAALEITSAAGDLLARWPYGELRAVEPLRPGIALRLSSSGMEEARLTLTGDAMLDALKARAPQLSSPRRLSGRKLCRGGAVLGAVAAALGVFWFLWPPLADVIASAIPASWEARLGRQVMAGFSSGSAVCADPRGMAALDRLTARLSAHVDGPHPLSVRVIDHPAVNAFAAPGGHVVLFRGLVEAAESADEVAGVLAHEVGHVTERHGMRALVRHSGLMLLVQMMSGGSDVAQIAPVLLMLSYSREFETEADRHAVDLLRGAGLRADGLSRFFARLERRDEERPAFLAYFSTHPPTAKRREATMPEAVRGESAMTSSDWTALRRICDGVD